MSAPEQDTPAPQPETAPTTSLATLYDLYENIAAIVHDPHESLTRYVDGGFHPVTLGDTFCDGRYIIRHRLGHGGFSSVWLADDSHQERRVSVKIKQAYLSTNDIEQDPDIKTLKALEQHYANTSTEHPRYFPQLFDYFHHFGPNGRHTCIVTQLLGPSLGAVLKVFRDIYSSDEIEVFRPDTILRATRQILEAIEFFQSVGIVHGDISPTNVAFTCNQALCNEEEFWDTLGGEPITTSYVGPEPRPPNLPKQLVKQACWEGWFDSPEEDICLIDWGESFPANETRPSKVAAQDAALRSPESVFVGSLDANHDLWGAGCVIFTIFYQRYPFYYPGSEIQHIKNLCLVLGPLPPNLQAKLDEKEANSESGTVSSPKSDPENPRLISETFEARREQVTSFRKIDEGEELTDHDETAFEALNCLQPLLKGLMHFEPQNRMSIQDALSSIDWTDHWRDGCVGNTEEEEGDRDGSVEGDNA